jgi:hypothetical protein
VAGAVGPPRAEPDRGPHDVAADTAALGTPGSVIRFSGLHRTRALPCGSNSQLTAHTASVNPGRLRSSISRPLGCPNIVKVSVLDY